LNDLDMLEHGHSTHEVSNLLGISQSTCSRICREYVPHVEPFQGRCLRSINLVQQRACVRAITVGGLDNDVDMRSPFNEYLNMVVSTNVVKRAFHKANPRLVEK
jgi:predicted transcriptional regulator